MPRKLVNSDLNGIVDFKSGGKLSSELKDESSSSWCAVPHEDLPSWLRINDYVCCGHRPQLESIFLCLTSIFRLHYDTLNIWSHFLAALWFANLWLFYFPPFLSTLQDQLFYSVHLWCCFLCYAFSTIYHIFFCHSYSTQCLFIKFDYIGISVNIYGQAVSWFYFLNYCHSTSMKIQLITATVLFFLSLVICLSPSFNDNNRKTELLRVFIYGCFVASVAITGTVQVLINYWNKNTNPVYYSFLLDLKYLVSSLFIAFRFPERWIGKSNYLIHSHFMMHTFVALASNDFSSAAYHIALDQMNTSLGIC